MAKVVLQAELDVAEHRRFKARCAMLGFRMGQVIARLVRAFNSKCQSASQLDAVEFGPRKEAK